MAQSTGHRAQGKAQSSGHRAQGKKTGARVDAGFDLSPAP